MENYVERYWDGFLNKCNKNQDCTFEIGNVRFKVYSNCRWSVSLIKKYLSYHLIHDNTKENCFHQIIIFKNTNLKFSDPSFVIKKWKDKLSDGTKLYISKLNKYYINVKVGKEVSMHIDNYANRTIIEYIDRTLGKKHVHPNPTSYMVSFLTIVLSYNNNFIIHSASVLDKNKSILILGGPGAGKTTLSLLLSKNGFIFRSDDLTIISCERNKIYSYPLLLKPKIKSKKYFNLYKYSYRNSLQKSEITKLFFIKYQKTHSFEFKPLYSFIIFKMLYGQLNDPKLYLNSKNLVALLFKISDSIQSYKWEIGPSEKFNKRTFENIL